jgi:hypothetical protein
MKALKKKVRIGTPKKEKVTRDEALERMKTFPERADKFIAVIREGTR